MRQDLETPRFSTNMSANAGQETKMSSWFSTAEDRPGEAALRSLLVALPGAKECASPPVDRGVVHVDTARQTRRGGDADKSIDPEEKRPGSF